MMSTLPPDLQRLVGSFIPWTERGYFIRTFPSQEHAVVSYTARNKSELPENALLKHVVLPKGLQEVGEKAFMWCSSIISVTFPQELRRVGDNAFVGCRMSEINLPDKLEQVPPR